MTRSEISEYIIENDLIPGNYLDYQIKATLSCTLSRLYKEKIIKRKKYENESVLKWYFPKKKKKMLVIKS